MYSTYCQRDIKIISRKSVSKNIAKKENYEIFLYVKYIKNTGFHGVIENNINEEDIHLWHIYYCKCVEKYGRTIVRKLKL